MRGLVIARTIVYMGGFIFLWGWLALYCRRFDPLLPFSISSSARPAGIVAIALGGAIVLTCGALFALRGRGTPALFDPPKEFVAIGPYRYVRNPMYIGGILALLGFSLWLRSPGAAALSALFGISIHIFVLLIEEPGLEARFGESYREYKRSVGRWLPRVATPILKS